MVCQQDIVFFVYLNQTQPMQFFVSAERMVNYYFDAIEYHGNEFVFNLNLDRALNSAMWARFGQYCQNATLRFTDGVGICITFGGIVSFIATNLNDNVMNVLKNSVEPNLQRISVIITPVRETYSPEGGGLIVNSIQLNFALRSNQDKIPLNLLLYKDSHEKTGADSDGNDWSEDERDQRIQDRENEARLRYNELREEAGWRRSA